MKARALVPLGLVLLGVGGALGLALGLVVGDTRDASADGGLPSAADIVVRSDDGEVRAYTPESAAARIESLEDLVRRRARRVASEDLDAQERAAPEPEIPTFREPPLLNEAGRPYTADEIRALARGSDDPDLRARAIRALRRIDTDAARTTLAAILDDPETSADLRLIAAQSLVRPPHRDHLPEELIRRLADESDAEIRRVLAGGVASLRDRGAWMREISGMLGDEADPEVRRTLLGAVARTAWDRAARQELLVVATAVGTPAEERAMALGALTRGRPDADTIAALQPLLLDADPGIRRTVLGILAADRGMPLATLDAGLSDADAGVRAAALAQAMQHLQRFRKDKDAPQGPVDAAAARAFALATGDPDPSVRAAGVTAARHLPGKERNAVLAAGREDADQHVRLVAYANSPRPVAIQATPEIVGALSSPDRRTRDYAYARLRRLHDIRVPFQGGWNDAARAAAIAEIRSEIAGGSAAGR